MPVIRQPIQIRDTRQIRPVQSPKSQMGNVLGQQADYLGQRAAQYGRLLSAEAEEKARAWAKQAIFSEDENGVPQMPEDITKGMGQVARETYNASMAEHMAQRLKVSVRNKINEAKIANMDDLDAFSAQANASIAKMQESIPPEFGGAFQSIVTDEMVNAQYDIGRTQAILERETTKAEIPEMLRTYQQSRGDLILGGGDDAAVQMHLQGDIDWILGQPDNIMSPLQKQKHIADFLFIAGAKRAQMDWDVENMSANQLTSLIAALKMPNSEQSKKLGEYFQRYDALRARVGLQPWAEGATGDKLYDEDLGARFASYLQSGPLQKAYQKDRAINDAAALEARINDINSGRIGNPTDTDRGTLNQYVSDVLGFPVTASMFENGTIEQEDMDQIILHTKNAGFLGSELRKAFNAAAVTQNPETFMNMYDIYVALKDQHNTAGPAVDISDLIPDDALQVFEVAEAQIGGGFIDDTTVAQTWEFMDRLRNLGDWTTKTRDISTAMKNENIDGNIWMGNDVTEDNIDAVISDLVVDYLEDNPHPDEIKQAVNYFQTRFRMQLQGNSDAPLERALEMTKQAFSNRWKDSKYFRDGVRTQYGPEKHYSAPMPKTLGEAIGRIWKKGIKAPVLEGLESIVPLFGFYKGENREFSEPDFGAALARAEPFDLIMDRKIHEVISNLPEDQKPFYELPYHTKKDGSYDETRNNLYEAGVHYYLEYVPGSGRFPRYNVIMLGSDMNHGVTHRVEGLQNIDVSADFKELTGQITTYDQAARYARAQKVVLDDVMQDQTLAPIMSPYGGASTLTVSSGMGLGLAWADIKRRIDELAGSYLQGAQ